MSRARNRGWVVDVSHIPSSPLTPCVIPLYSLLLSPSTHRTLHSRYILTSQPLSQDHDITVEFYFRSLADLEKVRADPDFQALQAGEGPYVNLVHTVASLGWVEKYVDGGKVVNLKDGKSMYPPWEELMDLSTAR